MASLPCLLHCLRYLKTVYPFRPCFLLVCMVSEGLLRSLLCPRGDRQPRLLLLDGGNLIWSIRKYQHASALFHHVELEAKQERKGKLVSTFLFREGFLEAASAGSFPRTASTTHAHTPVMIGSGKPRGLLPNNSLGLCTLSHDARGQQHGSEGRAWPGGIGLMPGSPGDPVLL